MLSRVSSSKPNQVGTITEALDAYRFAHEHEHEHEHEHGIIAVPSGRSGGVVDDVVMDFSVGLEVPFQKNGAAFWRTHRKTQLPDASECAKSGLPSLRHFPAAPIPGCPHFQTGDPCT